MNKSIKNFKICNNKFTRKRKNKKLTNLNMKKFSKNYKKMF